MHKEKLRYEASRFFRKKELRPVYGILKKQQIYSMIKIIDPNDAVGWETLSGIIAFTPRGSQGSILYHDDHKIGTRQGNSEKI